jgi:carotenoid isomerooxygenase
MQRKDGQLFKTYLAEAFFYLHIINSYEEDNHLIVDICCYKDPTMLDCMYVDALMVTVYVKYNDLVVCVTTLHI